MTHDPPGRRLLIALLAIAPTFIGHDRASAQSNNEGLDLSIELVDPKVLRVCADPRNLPFSNEKGEGFENKLAELFAVKLQKKLDYMYFPQATGFVRVTLGAHRCDVIMGFPQGDDLVQGTNPYYRTAYALISRQGSGLEDVTALNDAAPTCVTVPTKTILARRTLATAGCCAHAAWEGMRATRPSSPSRFMAAPGR